MSIETWMKEFYPAQATAYVSNLEALRHALLKYEGLRGDALERHDGSPEPMITLLK